MTNRSAIVENVDIIRPAPFWFGLVGEIKVTMTSADTFQTLNDFWQKVPWAQWRKELYAEGVCGLMTLSTVNVELHRTCVNKYTHSIHVVCIFKITCNVLLSTCIARTTKLFLAVSILLYLSFDFRGEMNTVCVCVFVWVCVCVCGRERKNNLKVIVTMPPTKECVFHTAWPSIKPKQLKPSHGEGNRHSTAVERSNMALVAQSKQRLRERLRRLAVREGNRLCKWPWPPTKGSQWSSSTLTGAES